MAKWKKVIAAGGLVVECVYPMVNGRDGPDTRQGKKQLSTAGQQMMNLKYAFQKMELSLAANFQPGDLFVTLTYDRDHLPWDRKEANQRLGAFFKKLRKARAAKGKELRYLYCTEHKHGDGRWHHHVLLNATGRDYETIRALWRWGGGVGGVDISKLRVNARQSYEALARYLCKEPRDRVGQRLWSGSRNLRKPEREVFRVDDDTPVYVPRGATELASVSRRTRYGCFQYVKYLAKGWDARQRA